MQRSFADDLVDRAAFGLLIVSDVVFYVRNYARALNACDFGNRHSAGYPGIFAEAFESSAALRNSQDIDVRCFEQIRTERFGLFELAIFGREFRIPGGCQRNRRGRSGGSQLRTGASRPNSCRAVRNSQRWNPKPR